MDKSNQRCSSSVSLQQLLEEVEDFILLESRQTNCYWISAARFAELFHEKHDISPEEVTKNQGHHGDLKSLIRSSKCFSIYNTPIPQEFYIAPFRVILPDFQVSHATPPIQYVDVDVVSELKSINSFEIALMAIIESLTADDSRGFVDIGMLSKRFSRTYQQPIKSVVSSISPGMRLIELLQTIPSLEVQKEDNNWQIKRKIQRAT